MSEVDTSAEAVEACIADKILAEKRVKELEKEAEEYRNTIAVTNMFYDCFKERMARKYGYDYNSDTSSDDSDSEDRNDDGKGKGMNKCERCNYAGKTEVGLKTHVTRRHR